MGWLAGRSTAVSVSVAASWLTLRAPAAEMRQAKRWPAASARRTGAVQWRLASGSSTDRCSASKPSILAPRASADRCSTGEASTEAAKATSEPKVCQVVITDLCLDPAPQRAPQQHSAGRTRVYTAHRERGKAGASRDRPHRSTPLCPAAVVDGATAIAQCGRRARTERDAGARSALVVLRFAVRAMRSSCPAIQNRSWPRYKAAAAVA